MNLIARLHARNGRGARCGLAALEFALTLPIWITLVLGVADGTYYMLVNEKEDRIAYTISDIVTQYQDPITKANLNDITSAASQLMDPYSFGANGVVIISSIYKQTGQNPIIKWQYTGGGTLMKSSKVGTTGGTATIPNGLTLNDGDGLVITEVYYNFKPLFISDAVFPASSLYRVALYKPRLGPLLTTPS